ncbi:ABC transporter permease [Conexibacter sp. SYSU D00693]|uniref:MlaE family ABC transporter permease n=1 Tax=Conexibacter sp. SYSU D00693 TaxID=2812560 RepID=UPI00196AC69A|nr:ABC transporter permease [Conexibacter sp. SYSU D00693]
MAVRPLDTAPAEPPIKHSRETAFTEFGELVVFSLGALRAVPQSARYFSEVLRQTGLLVRGSTGFIALMSAAIGFSATSFGYYFLKAAGAADYIGLVPGVTNARFTAALMFAYAFAAKVGCGLVGEIGAMKVSEELDGFESEGVSVQKYVVGTRVAATILFAPIATAVSLVGGTIGAYINSVVIVRAVSSETFFRYNWGNQSPFDQAFALISVLVVGTIITLVSCYYGTRAKGGPAGVGVAVARSLVVNLVLIHIVLGLMVFGAYGKDLGLPIGG